MFRDAGCDILGVEIDPRMAEVARRSGLDVEVAPFETWDSAGRIFDLLISGQAWHWVDPVGGAVKAASLLPAGGRVALFWNVGAPSPEVAEELNEVYRRLAPGLDDYSVLLGHGDPDRFVHGADGLRSTEQFSEPERWIFQWEREYSRAEWLDQLPTHSDHRSLDPERREVLLSAVGEVIDAMGGSFVMHYSAAVLTATRNA
jgi:SAM-dependent methyltransferase